MCQHKQYLISHSSHQAVYIGDNQKCLENATCQAIISWVNIPSNHYQNTVSPSVTVKDSNRSLNTVPLTETLFPIYTFYNKCMYT